MTAMPVLAIEEIMERYLALLAGGTSPTPINMAMGTSSFDTRPFVDLGAHATQVDVRRYRDPLGDHALREALHAFYRERYQVDISPQRFLVTDGALGALTVAFAALLEPGDEVILPAAHFSPYRSLVSLFGGKWVLGPLNAENTYDVDGVARLITPRTKVIVANSPSNPLGSVAAREEMEALAELGPVVISDEVYDVFGFSRPVTSMVEVSASHFVVNSLSKSFAAAGLRLGYLIAPEGQMDGALQVKSAINFCTSALVQAAGIEFLRAWRPCLEAHHAFVRDNREHLIDACARLGLTLEGTPAGGFYALLRGPECTDSVQLARDLLEEQRVAIFPASDLGAMDQRLIRINYACERDELTEALSRIRAFMDSKR